MSKELHDKKHTGEHGTTESYMIGFVLSLAFTVIPYYLVVNQILSGTVLLVTILGIAVLQMLIQIFFFLHLGRGPKPLYNVAFFFATIGIILLTIGGSLFIMSNLYKNMSPSETTTKLAQKEGISQVSGKETGACQGVKDSHVVTISKGKADPAAIEARRCDTLTLINEDNQTREITFGVHPQQNTYGGESEVLLHKGEPETITLNQTGEYTFYDYLAPSTAGTFTVTE